MKRSIGTLFFIQEWFRIILHCRTWYYAVLSICYHTTKKIDGTVFFQSINLAKSYILGKEMVESDKYAENYEITKKILNASKPVEVGCHLPWITFAAIENSRVDAQLITFHDVIEGVNSKGNEENIQYIDYEGCALSKMNYMMMSLLIFGKMSRSNDIRCFLYYIFKTYSRLCRNKSYLDWKKVQDQPLSFEYQFLQDIFSACHRIEKSMSQTEFEKLKLYNEEEDIRSLFGKDDGWYTLLHIANTQLNPSYSSGQLEIRTIASLFNFKLGVLHATSKAASKKRLRMNLKNELGNTALRKTHSIILMIQNQELH